MSADDRLLCEDEVMGLMLNKEADVMEVMTLNEAIQRCEEVAKENREYAEDALQRYKLGPNEITKQDHDRCKQCASEYKQLAEWLKDYKRLLEREPCEDAISRAEAIRIASGYCYYTNIPKELEKLPAVQPEPKTGEWIFVDKVHEHAHFSECDYGNVDLLNGRPHNYCPNCGAKMIEPQESEDKE